MALESVWMHAMGRAEDVVGQAQVAETEGWDGVLVPGSPLFVADPWVAIALAARETSRIAFGTGVATPVPQVAGYLAGATTTLQQSFPGRVVLGLGRGDRAAASFGLSPMPVATFERYVARLQGYLRGEELAFDPDLDGGGRFPPSDRSGDGALTASVWRCSSRRTTRCRRCRWRCSPPAPGSSASVPVTPTV